MITRSASGWPTPFLQPVPHFPQVCPSTAVQRLTSMFTQIIHTFIHSALPWQTARAGVIGACSHAGPGFSLPACRAVIAPCLDRNADHAQDVPEAPRDSSLAQVAQLSLRVCNAVACRGDAAPHPGPPSETGDQGGHLLAGRARPPRGISRDRNGSLRSSLRAYPCRPGENRGGARPGRYPHAASWRRDGPGKVRIEHPLNTVCSIAVQQPGHTPPIERDHYFRRREQRNDLR